MKNIILSAAILICATSIAQEVKITNLSFSGYLETYYSYDVNNPALNSKPSFIYSHNRNNEVNINLGFVKATYSDSLLRGNLSFGVGTYMNANYISEPGVLKNIYEANVGVKLSKNHNLWLDAGVLPSHIGWESAVGKDCPTLSRSLAAENSPYFETGVKLGYTSNSGKWYLSALVLNGWQRIQRIDGNTTPGFGHQVTYKASEAITINSSSFIGNDKNDSIRQMRYFHDLYGSFRLNPKITMVAGFDIGAEQKSKRSSDMNYWYTPVLILKYSISPKAAIAARGEFFSDRNGVIVATGTPNGFSTTGFSGNFDYSVSSNAVWRIEVRNLNSRDGIFPDSEGRARNNSMSISTTLALSF